MIVLNKPIIFVGGLVIGAAGGVLSTMAYFKNKYNKIADQQIREMEAYYQKSDVFARGEYENDDNAEINPIDSAKERYIKLADDYNNSNDITERDLMNKDTREEIRAKLLKNHEITTAYSNMYDKEGNRIDQNVKAGDLQRFFKEGEEIEDPEYGMSEADKATADHLEHRNDPPKIISLQEFDDLPNYIDRSTLYFYNLDEVVADDNDEAIENPGMFLGNCLDEFIDSGNDALFVYNPGLDTAYEIQRVDGSWFNDN